MLTLKQINQKIRGAFLPFRCDVDVDDRDAKICFKVFDHSRNRIYEISRLPKSRVQDEGYLNSLLSRVRCRVQESGYTLKPLT